LVTLAAIVLLAFGGWLLWSLTGSSEPGSPSKKDTDTPSTQLDKVKPTVELNIPESSLALKSQGSFEVSAIASDNSLVTRVEYLVDGVVIATSVYPPFKVLIDLGELAAGEHTLQAVAYDLVGNSGKSRVFTFTVHDDTVVPGDSTSHSIVRQSSSKKLQMPGGISSGGNTGGNTGGTGGDPDPGGGGDDDGEDVSTPWPDVPPAAICGDTALLSGPSTAPTGAVVVPAGDNDGINFRLANTTYWFAPGTHTLGTDPLGQIIPSDNSTFIGGPGAVLDGQGINDYAFTQDNENVTIKYLTIQNFDTPQNEGAVNHDSGVGWTIQYNTIQNNGGGGVFAGTDNTISYNCLKDNGQYGFQVYSDDVGGPQNVILDHNEIVGNNQDDWETQVPGCGCTGAGKFWEANHVDVTNNYIHDNLSVGLWADTNDNDFLIEGNYIEGNHGQGIFYEIAYNMIVRNNNFIGNAVVDGPGNPSFPTGAIYLSEAGGDSRVPARTDKIDIYDNQFLDNWSGVILWENADRFCNSPANTSTGTCTLVNPAATLTTCNDPSLGGEIDQEPYYSDCRWKTQNVKVHDNVFNYNKANIPGCAANTGCGYQGIFSNTGTFPTWSPYKGDLIQEAITFNQNNEFTDNEYIGVWNFRAYSEGSLYNFALWQNPPYSQDTGSMYNGADHMTVTNALDDNTATLEGGIGSWVDWFGTMPTRSNEQAHTGSYSLRVEQTSNFWGVQLSNTSGVPVTTVPQVVSFWGKLGSGTTVGARMRLIWIDRDGTSLQQDDITLNPFTTNWQQASLAVTPPPNTATVSVQFLHGSSGGTGTSGDYFYLDDIVIADAE
jgi:hypothetical protein